MKIVALDTYVTDFDGLPWPQMASFGEFEKHDRTTPDEVVTRAEGAQAILINKIVLNSTNLLQLPALRYIGVTATGTNSVDLGLARSRGIKVANVPGYSTDSVAQHTIAIILHFASQVNTHHEAVQTGEWAQSGSWCYCKAPLVELKGKELGIIGHGNIGRKVAEIAGALGMSIMLAAIPGKTYNNKRFSLDEIFEKADFVTLHCPLTEVTKQIINRDSLRKMKNSCVVVNTSRGGLVNERDLAIALENGQIYGAGLDVLSQEPPEPENPLLHAPNTVITPHIAWATRDARTRLIHETEENLKAYIAGENRNLVLN